MAVIVNDMSEVNIDVDLVRGLPGSEKTASDNVALNRAEERLVEMSNGCICCTLREDLLMEVRQLAEEGRFDSLVIESTGISEPNWPDDPVDREAIMEKWQGPFGDMRQELVFIGQVLDEARIRQALDACLLSEEEMLAGQELWRTFPDPFPAWE